jgi:type II restriction/modification system DNA methylase subunit YeeA
MAEEKEARLMDTRSLEKFARAARRQLHEQVGAKVERVVRTDSAELREQAAAVQTLKEEVKAHGKAAVVERAAYTWFNRFCALRFMDANHYTAMGVVSPAAGFTQPEILQEAKQGVIDEDLPVDRRRVADLLGGRLPARDAQQEAYRLLLVASCNSLHGAMPYLFEPIADYTELLLPDDLLSAASILQAVRDALSEAVCQDEEVIGWLYQYYIAEKKEEVDAKVKAGGKVEADELPAKTSLYTPDWIVRFLVDNSLGRLWMANRPRSRLAERMAYYIAPEEGDSGAQEGLGPRKEGHDGVVSVRVERRDIDISCPSSRTTDPAEQEGHDGIVSVRGERRDIDISCPSSRTTDPAAQEGHDGIVSVRVSSPEELRVGDSAVGSAHMLLYAFELLYAIYEEEGYNPPDIARLILEKNLYGMEIDPRAAALAAFALTMKARRYDRRFLRRGVRPHICVLHSVRFTAPELAATPWLAKLGATLTDLPVRDALLHDLEAAALLDNVGSLLRPQLTPAQIGRVREVIGAADDLFTHGFNERVLDVLAQMEYLARRHHVVVANPPYLGKGMNEELKEFLGQEYGDVKSDLFSAFVVRNTELTVHGGQLGFMTPFVWMFISSYQKLREFLITQKTITNLVQLEYSGFEGATVPICTFTLENAHDPELKGGYIRLSDFRGADNQAPKTLEAIQNPACGWFYRASAADFRKIPGAPIAYWFSEKTFNCFELNPILAEFFEPQVGLQTSNTERFIRIWPEVSFANLFLNARNNDEAADSHCKWFPLDKGGTFRRWYGNNDHIVNWALNGLEIKQYVSERYPYLNGNVDYVVKDRGFFFRPGVTWTKVSSGTFSVRETFGGSIFSDAGMKVPTDDDQDLNLLSRYLNSKVTHHFLSALSPTLNFEKGAISSLPFKRVDISDENEDKIVQHAITDWNSFEVSYHFTTLPLLRPEHRQATLAATYAHLRRHWQAMTGEMQRLEVENNRLFIDAYGLQDELTPDVPLHEITLTCNPPYRYGAGKSDAEYARLLLADTLREFLSYAVGCMFGRYSLEKAGLVLANQGEGVEDYARKIGETGDWRLEIGEERAAKPNLQSPNLQSPTLPISFPPDRDNVIPILDGEWFADDIVERCKRFLRVTFGEEHYAENLAFVEQGLGRDLRGYFLREFYDDHVRRYQKRPIYWLFSSPKGSFNALIYMHRYRPDTVSVVLNDYLRDFQNKLAAHRSHLERVSISAASSPRDKTAALKEIDKVEKMIAELAAYERDVLYPLATQQVAIDLDDGVKVNYAKFGKALRRIVGVSG